MQETGLLNRGLSRVISEQGHHDMLMVVDAGFAIPKGLDVVDLSLNKNIPTVLEVLAVLNDHHSVEKLVMAHETKNISPTLFQNISQAFGENKEVELLDHTALKVKSREVKAVIRTGDFTAYANVILVSGAGDRWYLEKA
jgi:D-ribose pyranase